ncbi:uncharacterized protein LOC128952166 [Oppia nitens]|uniref:uncharacterized protein LOC128952166 n=1 Tax=Oppia nitens TaxID=1686743 RepID=UPI0023DB4D66|nr:uncharacterized protein LOC128952166 [Oppia nitens]XP_054153487.1 uncharacterized protein LOC128952166 [Oppia nitens]
MKYLNIIIFNIITIIICQPIDGRFIGNPFLWLQWSAAQNETNILSLNETTATTTTDKSNDTLLERPITQVVSVPPPILLSTESTRPLPVRQPESLLLPQLGVPVKSNRFGLEPLIRPIESTDQDFHSLQPHKSVSSIQFHKRVGDIIESSAQSPSTTQSSNAKDIINKDLIEKFWTPDNTNNPFDIKFIDTEDMINKTTDDSTESETQAMDTVSPMPVFKSSNNDNINEMTKSIKPLITSDVDSDQFVDMLNKLYYNKPFEPIDRFGPKSFK